MRFPLFPGFVILLVASDRQKCTVWLLRAAYQAACPSIGVLLRLFSGCMTASPGYQHNALQHLGRCVLGSDVGHCCPVRARGLCHSLAVVVARTVALSEEQGVVYVLLA